MSGHGLGYRGGRERDAGRADIVSEDAAELVVGDFADEPGAAAQ